MIMSLLKCFIVFILDIFLYDLYTFLKVFFTVKAELKAIFLISVPEMSFFPPSEALDRPASSHLETAGLQPWTGERSRGVCRGGGPWRLGGSQVVLVCLSSGTPLPSSPNFKI